MTDPLPTIEGRDKAAQEAGYENWLIFEEASFPHSPVYHSILAHARTLDKLHNRTPVDPDVEAVERILAAWYGVANVNRAGDSFEAAVAQYKEEIGRG